jgi:DNA topoisomerase-1
VTLEQALELFKLPRSVGEYDGEMVKANVGRFGPYIQIGKLFVSIPKEFDPISISLDKAIELIDAKRQDEANKVIKLFDDRPDVQLLNGRYGAYLKIGKDNFKLPKGKEAAELNLEECLVIAENQLKNPSKSKSRAKKK